MASTFLSGRSVVVGSTIAVKALPSNRKLRQRVSAAVQEPPVSKKELRKPRNENVDAEKGFFVDHTCIGTVPQHFFRPWLTRWPDSLTTRI